MRFPVKAFFLLALCALFGAGAALEASVLSISPAAFHPANSWTASLNWYVTGDAFWLDASPDATAFIASITLPSDALVKKITAWVTVDTGAGVDDELYFIMERHNLATGVQDTMATLYSAGLPLSSSRQALSTSAVSFRKINNYGYTYDVFVVFHSGSTDHLKFKGVRVEY